MLNTVNIPACFTIVEPHHQCSTTTYLRELPQPSCLPVNNPNLYYTHTFPDTTSRTIVIKGQNITHLSYLSLELQALDVSKTALSYLECQNNLLTAEGLNALFGTLNTYAGRGLKIISIFGNPGTADCDRSIAEDKGWVVYLPSI